MNLKKLELQAQIDTPFILLDPQSGICDIVGNSYPEDISSFYKQIVNWFDDYSFYGVKDLTLNMKLSYFNSASQKVFTEIFEKLMDNENFKVKVNWYYVKEDDEILENGRIFQALSGFEFHFFINNA
jgi:hypothetical protein